MPAILRHPRFSRIEARPPLNIAALRAESDALDYAEQREQTQVWQIRRARQLEALRDAAWGLVTLLLAGAVLAAVAWFRVGEP